MRRAGKADGLADHVVGVLLQDGQLLRARHPPERRHGHVLEKRVLAGDGSR
jgi:hypothetical protein